MGMRKLPQSHILMSRSPRSPIFTRSPSLLPPPSSPLPPPLLTLPLPLLLPQSLLTTMLLPQSLLTTTLLPQSLLTTMLLPQLTTTTSAMLPLPTPRLLPRLPKRCHSTFDDEDIQRRYLRQAVINCDKRIS